MEEEGDECALSANAFEVGERVIFVEPGLFDPPGMSCITPIGMGRDKAYLSIVAMCFGSWKSTTHAWTVVGRGSVACGDEGMAWMVEYRVRHRQVFFLLFENEFLPCEWKVAFFHDVVLISGRGSCDDTVSASLDGIGG